MSEPLTDEAGRPVGLPASVMPEGYAHLHRDAVEVLHAWRAPDADGEATRRRILDVLDADRTAMWRHHSRVHLTASLVVIDASAEHVALTLHAKARRWFQFGGHLEAEDTSVAGAALREGVEESGLADLWLLPGLLQVDAHELPSAFQWCREHLDLRFAAVVPAPDDVRVSDESLDVRWFRINELPDDTEASLRDAILAARSAVLGGFGASSPQS